MQTINATLQSVNEVFISREFIIPEFQRPYSWDEDECTRLLSDLTSFYDSLSGASKDNKYFLGNIIIYPRSNKNVWNVIDGQQRLTTLLMLMRALYQKAGVNQNEFLKRRIYKVDPSTDEIMEEVRLESEVQPEDKRNDREDLRKTMVQDFEGMDSKNPFKLNYARLEKDLDKWWRNNDGKRDGFIAFLRDKVVLLLIECQSELDTLTLFETINNRGKPLDDADIFKARIYGAVDKKERSDFVARWNDMEDHVDYFQFYMHILKAREEVSTGKYCGARSKMKNYIGDHLQNKTLPPLKKRWKSIMDSLELCHHFYESGGNWTKDKDFSAREEIYWTILGKHPNENWQYPLFSFIHKHAKIHGGNLELSENKRIEYLDLLESAVRFFFMRGVIYNSIEAVRNESHAVCVQIEEGKTRPNYASQIKEKDLKELEERLRVSSSYGRYKSGLVFLNSFLNPRQQEKNATIVYAEKIGGKIHIEHILPKKWCNYDKWNKVLHEENFEKIGNLMPLEQLQNITASNEFFARKQIEYQSSQVQDAIDLSKKKPARWYPKDLEDRHKDSLGRLKIFFRNTKSKK